MTTNTIVLQGSVTPDGTLEVEGKVPLPPGKVQITLSPMPDLPAGDPFFEMLRHIWAMRQKAGLQPRTVDQVEAERRHFRDEIDEEIAEAGRLQEECWQARQEPP